MVDALRYIDFGLIGLSGKFQGKDSSLLPNRQWIQRQKHKKQPWSNVECFAFGGATVRFAALETSFPCRQPHNPTATLLRGLTTLPQG